MNFVLVRDQGNVIAYVRSYFAIDLNALVGSYAAVLPNLNLSNDDKEECSTVLLWLKNIIETGHSE